MQVAPLRRAQRGLAGLAAHERDDLLREPLHLLVLLLLQFSPQHEEMERFAIRSGVPTRPELSPRFETE